jgi:hypothetical protein
LVPRALLLLPLLLCLCFASAASAQTPEHTGVTLSGGDLARPVKLARADEDAFLRRLVPPPKLDDAPRVSGESYVVTTQYWDDVLRGDRDDREAAEPAADYYQEGGYVRARQGGKDAWLVLDLRQRAILDRYLSLARAALLRPEPAVLEVLTIASRSQEISIEAGGVALDAAQRRNFWTTLAVSPRGEHVEPPRPPLGARGIWLVFGLEEGRSVQVFYERDAGLFIDFFGSEIYTVSTPMAALLDAVVPRSSGGISIEQQDGTGSPLWWLLLVGGGVACLAVAAWLRRALAPAA